MFRKKSVIKITFDPYHNLPQMKAKNCTKEQIRDAGPNGFHIDVFSDDPEAWREARVREAAMREDMMNQQKKIAKEVMLKNKDKIYGAWIMYTFPELLEGELNAIINYEKPKWASHPILKAK